MVPVDALAAEVAAVTVVQEEEVVWAAEDMAAAVMEEEEAVVTAAVMVVLPAVVTVDMAAVAAVMEVVMEVMEVVVEGMVVMVEVTEVLKGMEGMADIMEEVGVVMEEVMVVVVVQVMAEVEEGMAVVGMVEAEDTTVRAAEGRGMIIPEAGDEGVARLMEGLEAAAGLGIMEGMASMGQEGAAAVGEIRDAGSRAGTGRIEAVRGSAGGPTIKTFAWATIQACGDVVAAAGMRERLILQKYIATGGSIPVFGVD